MTNPSPAASPPTYRIAFGSCPLCGEGRDLSFVCNADISKHPLYDKRLPKGFTWLKCGACRHVFTSHYWSPEAMDIILAKANPSQMPGHDIEQQRLVWARTVDKIDLLVGMVRDRNAGPPAWIDVGFGSGNLLLTAQEWGFEVHGLDLRQAVVAKIGEYGVHAVACDITEYAARSDHRAHAVVSLADVIEHVQNPKEFLTAARDLMEPTGVLFVSTPNMATAVWREWDRKGENPYWGELEHCHTFTRQRLYDLLRETGFNPIRYGVSIRYRAGMDIIARVA